MEIEEGYKTPHTDKFQERLEKVFPFWETLFDNTGYSSNSFSQKDVVPTVYRKIILKEDKGTILKMFPLLNIDTFEKKNAYIGYLLHECIKNQRWVLKVVEKVIAKRLSLNSYGYLYVSNKKIEDGKSLVGFTKKYIDEAIKLNKYLYLFKKIEKPLADLYRKIADKKLKTDKGSQEDLKNFNEKYVPEMIEKVEKVIMEEEKTLKSLIEEDVSQALNILIKYYPYLKEKISGFQKEFCSNNKNCLTEHIMQFLPEEVSTKIVENIIESPKNAGNFIIEDLFLKVNKELKKVISQSKLKRNLKYS